MINSILLTGGSGFLGKAVHKTLAEQYPNTNITIPRSTNYDLRNQKSCSSLFVDTEPQVVVHLAATCGGIGANRENPGQYFYDNITMGVNLIENCRKFNVQKIILIGTVCSYPKYCSIPFKENDIWNGYPEETNAPYGIAKKALYTMLEAYKQQYNTEYLVLIPTNLYGPYDNFQDNSSHVIPALIKKIHKAKKKKSKVSVWGNGSATREFLYVNDAARAISQSIETQTEHRIMNLGSGEEISILNLTNTICELMDFDKNNIEWDHSKPNGQPKRMVCVDRAKKELAWNNQTNLKEGLKETISWYISNYA